MSSDVLRRAAALMRERADAAPEPSPWVVMRSLTVASIPEGSRLAASVANVYPTGGSEHQRAAATHIASWHPAVALAVADWLEVEAHNADAGIGGRAFHSIGGQSDALAVARAYLGEA